MTSTCGTSCIPDASEVFSTNRGYYFIAFIIHLISIKPSNRSEYISYRRVIKIGIVINRSTNIISPVAWSTVWNIIATTSLGPFKGVKLSCHTIVTFNFNLWIDGVVIRNFIRCSVWMCYQQSSCTISTRIKHWFASCFPSDLRIVRQSFISYSTYKLFWM